MKKKMIVLSIDSMIGEDLPLLNGLPNFSRILQESSVVRKMRSTYPTLTHSVHTSIQTGCYPGRHGVINNELCMPLTPKAPWYEDAAEVKCPTLPQVAARHGYRSAYLFWPVSMHADVPWNLHRAFIHTPKSHTQEDIRKRSTPGLFDEVAPCVSRCWKLPHYECGDLFCSLSGAYLIRNYQPDIMYIHMVLIDHIRHIHGVFNDQLENAYAFLDRALGELLNALDETDLWDSTIFCLTSDHGQLDITHSVSLNRLFADEGLCGISENGEMLWWDAYAHSCALSAQIYIQNHDPEVTSRVRSLLDRHREALGIGRIFTVEETRVLYHSWGDYSFMVETDGKTGFGYDLSAPLICPVDNSDYRCSIASHGHIPENGPQPCFAVRNPFGKKTITIEHGRIIDQAPTLARLLGFEMPDCDGSPIQELL